MFFVISLKWRTISFTPICFTASDKTRVALLGVMECVHLSEKTKSPLKFHSLCVTVVEFGVLWVKWTFLWPWFYFIALASTCNATQIQLTVWVRIFSQCMRTYVSVCTRFSKRMLEPEMEALPCFWETCWSAAILPQKESHIVLLCWPRACTHFLLSPWMVLELNMRCCWFNPTFSQARNSDCHHRHYHRSSVCSDEKCQCWKRPGISNLNVSVQSVAHFKSSWW